MTKILVTGGAGYIGSHTVAELLGKGYGVVVADNFSNSRKEVLASLEKITGTKINFELLDFCDQLSVEGFLENNKFDAVIHFAAFKAVNESVEQPLKYYRNNILSLLNLAKALEKNPPANIVFSSSCSVYGEPDKLPVDENAPLKKAESPYAATKQICERILSDIGQVSKIKTIALRYFNPVGAHESALIGEYPLNVPNNLVPVITQTAIGIRKEMQVFGNDYDTPDGTCIRDYIHVEDIAKAHVVAVDRLLNIKLNEGFEIFNLGTGMGHSVLEVINTFEKVSGLKLNYRITDRRKGDVVKVYSDTKLANTVLGWKAEKNLDDMLSSAWKWERMLAGLVV